MHLEYMTSSLYLTGSLNLIGAVSRCLRSFRVLEGAVMLNSASSCTVCPLGTHKNILSNEFERSK